MLKLATLYLREEFIEPYDTYINDISTDFVAQCTSEMSEPHNESKVPNIKTKH